MRIKTLWCKITGRHEEQTSPVEVNVSSADEAHYTKVITFIEPCPYCQYIFSKSIALSENQTIYTNAMNTILKQLLDRDADLHQKITAITTTAIPRMQASLDSANAQLAELKKQASEGSTLGPGDIAAIQQTLKTTEDDLTTLTVLLPTTDGSQATEPTPPPTVEVDSKDSNAPVTGETTTNRSDAPATTESEIATEGSAEGTTSEAKPTVE